ncbi:hypothetical protein P5673_021425 [Acropora cervicornis]|uniref:Uncharacterized protein n=1 Tax=Acropora cervicornis TaxID=6130 RepID=A0AAD9Q855_ACRCE|nr:hypothetical protein P5673_021425 [Acropora cervicornis]
MVPMLFETGQAIPPSCPLSFFIPCLSAGVSRRLVFKEALADGNGILTLQNLINRYEDFGGSAKIARELFNMLQPRHDDYVTQEEMTERLDDVLKLYLKQKDEDISGIHYEKEWAEDKEIMKQTLPSANNLDAMATTESAHNEL